MSSKKRAASERDGKQKSKKQRTEKSAANSSIATFLTSDTSAVDPTLASLFTVAAPPVVPSQVESDSTVHEAERDESIVGSTTSDNEPDEDIDDNEDSDNADTLSSVSEELDYSSDDADMTDVKSVEFSPVASLSSTAKDDDGTRRKRKRKDEHENLEHEHLSRLARIEQRAAVKEGRAVLDVPDVPMHETLASQDDQHDGADDSDDAHPPTHESLQPQSGDDMQRAQRTVFVSNVSIQAIKSKSARKELMAHMSSFFTSQPAPTKDQPAHAIESIRFRSTAYAGKIPKKASFAKKELMDATTVSTNAYVVYNAQALARTAARKLNGTVVLDRHIHVDEVAHPAKIDHTRCVFVGNLGFVDDESNIDAANAESGREVRRGRKTPSDIEEGLWRTFATCGTVENVRVVRDNKTRVGKGIAYVQFTDDVSVEAALLLNDRKFPPMLPRKLRVSRAKAHKRNAKPSEDSTRSFGAQRVVGRGGKKGGYVPKMTPEQHSAMGRASRLLGHAASAKMRMGKTPAIAVGAQRGPSSSGPAAPGVRKPESFVFEGHRASAGKKSGKGGKMAGKPKVGKPTNRSAKRGTEWKKSGGKKD